MLYFICMQHRSRTLAPLLSFVIVCALGIAWTVSASSSSPQEYALYTNERCHFSFVLPAGMTVETHDNSDNGQTFQFTDPAGDFFFQVGTTPYTQLDVLLEEEGLPNKSFDQSTELGVINVFRGDVFRVWFVRNGTFYSASTLPQNEARFIDILKTWQFD